MHLFDHLFSGGPLLQLLGARGREARLCHQEAPGGPDCRTQAVGRIYEAGITSVVSARVLHLLSSTVSSVLEVFGSRWPLSGCTRCQLLSGWLVDFTLLCFTGGWWFHGRRELLPGWCIHLPHLCLCLLLLVRWLEGLKTDCLKKEMHASLPS